MEDAELITYDNCKEETIKSRELQESLGQLIKRMGGKTAVLYHLIAKESPDWFMVREVKYAHMRYGNMLNERNKAVYIKHPERSKIWLQWQVDILNANWETMDIPHIGRLVGKTFSATKEKARAIMTKEKFENRFYNKNTMKSTKPATVSRNRYRKK